MNTYIDIKDCVPRLKPGVKYAELQIKSGSVYEVEFTRQKTGYGEKTFFVCPKCGSRRTKLYIWRGRLLCRECYPLPVYRGIKNVVMGGDDYISHRMMRFADKEGIQLKRFPFCYLDYEKPKYKHGERWCMTITKLQAFENMRNQAIFFRKRYSLPVINSILQERNAYLYALDLYDIYKYFYDWDRGYLEFPGNAGKVQASGVCSNATQYQMGVLKTIS